jgi:hypothetical protein
MNNPYDLHSWSKHYREERLTVEDRRHLVEQARTGRERRQSGQLGPSWRSPLALLREPSSTNSSSPGRKDAT